MEFTAWFLLLFLQRLKYLPLLACLWIMKLREFHLIKKVIMNSCQSVKLFFKHLSNYKPPPPPRPLCCKSLRPPLHSLLLMENRLCRWPTHIPTSHHRNSHSSQTERLSATSQTPTLNESHDEDGVGFSPSLFFLFYI